MKKTTVAMLISIFIFIFSTFTSYAGDINFQDVNYDNSKLFGTVSAAALFAASDGAFKVSPSTFDFLPTEALNAEYYNALRSMQPYMKAMKDWDPNCIVLKPGKIVVNAVGIDLNMFTDFCITLNEYLFGDQALSGSPITTTKDTPFTVNINGENIIPFTVAEDPKAGTISEAGNVVDLSGDYVRSLGQYLVPDGGNYAQFWDTINTSQPSSIYSGYTGYKFLVLKSNGSTENIAPSSSTGFRAYSGNSSSSGDYIVVRTKKPESTNYTSTGSNMVFRQSSLNQDIAFAFMPVYYQKNDTLRMYTFSFVYDGFQPSGWSSNFLYTGYGYNAITSPMKDNHGTMTYSTTGLTQQMIENIWAPTYNNQSITYNYNSDLPDDASEDDILDEINRKISDGTLDISKPSNYVDPLTDWDTSGGGNINLGGENGDWNINFKMPDLNIDWSFDGIKEKFPFSIPWDLMHLFSVFDAEPETPALNASIDFGVAVWEIDWDFHDFDNIASLMRNLEFVAFCVYLALATRSLIKG